MAALSIRLALVPARHQIEKDGDVGRGARLVGDGPSERKAGSVGSKPNTLHGSIDVGDFILMLLQNSKFVLCYCANVFLFLLKQGETFF